MHIRVVAALLVGPVNGVLSAQRSAPVAPIVSGVTDTIRPRPADPGALPPWKPMEPRLARTLAEITFINVVAAGVNTLARDITSPSLGTWWDNIRGGWEWDPNMIRVNHLEHPWAGAAYFNSARANGLSFWGSAPMALAGSLMWELFGESKPPSTNDLLSTSLTGAALGEPLRRLSLMIIDEESSGIDRLWREIAAFLVNPGLGLNRMSRGQSWSRRQNPPGRYPEALRGGAGFGLRHFARSDGHDFGTPLLSVTLEYGDPFAGRERGPFSSFSAGMEFVGSSPDGLGWLNARGLLVAFGAGDRAGNRLGGLFMEFDYRLDGAVEFAQQSFGVGRLSRNELGSGFRLAADVSAEAVPILAVRDRYSKPLTGRQYDYGAGVGARVLAQLEHRGQRVLSAGGRTYWGPTLDGASEAKAVQILSVDARLPLVWSLSLGGSYQLYRQNSTYDGRPSETERVSSFSVLLSSGR